jgi:hypothetical protein
MTIDQMEAEFVLDRDLDFPRVSGIVHTLAEMHNEIGRGEKISPDEFQNRIGEYCPEENYHYDFARGVLIAFCGHKQWPSLYNHIQSGGFNVPNRR